MRPAYVDDILFWRCKCGQLLNVDGKVQCLRCKMVNSDHAGLTIEWLYRAGDELLHA